MLEQSRRKSNCIENSVHDISHTLLEVIRRLECVVCPQDLSLDTKHLPLHSLSHVPHHPFSDRLKSPTYSKSFAMAPMAINGTYTVGSERTTAASHDNHAHGVDGTGHVDSHSTTATAEPSDGHASHFGSSPSSAVDETNNVNRPLNSPASRDDQPIAICGMACRLPGGLHTPQQLWDFLLAKGDARTRVPESRYNVDAFYDPSGRPGTVKTEYGYFLDYDISKSDGAFSSFVRGATEREDPHQRQMSEVARECIEDAGEANYRGKLIGCYVGSFGEDWCEMFAKDTQQHGLYRVAGYGDFMLSNNVAYEMDLKGPRCVHADRLHTSRRFTDILLA